MNMTSKRFILWLCVILWMGSIFFLSAQTAAKSSGLSGQTIHTLIPIFMPEFIDMSRVQQNEIVLPCIAYGAGCSPKAAIPYGNYEVAMVHHIPVQIMHTIRGIVVG